MSALRRVVSLTVLAAGLAGCVVYPDGTMVPLAAPPPTASVVVGVGPTWGGYGHYYRRWWGGHHHPWHGYYGPLPPHGWRRW